MTPQHSRAVQAVTAATLTVALTALGLPSAASAADPADPANPAKATGAVRVASAQVRAPVLAGPTTGYDNIGVRRGNIWLLHTSLAGRTPTIAFHEGPASGYPLTGDFDGDGNDGRGLYRDGQWLLTEGRDGDPARVRFGLPGDIPVVGDWNDDGHDDLGLFRRGLWVLRTAGISYRFTFGRPGDRPVTGDWDGDGYSGIGVRRGNLMILRDLPGSGAPDYVLRYGRPGDLPISGDWNHDGKDDIGVFRAGRWFFRMPDGSTQTFSFGRAGDVPVVRRTNSLAPGVSHQMLALRGSRVQVLRLDLSAASTAMPVIAQGRIGGLERTTSQARRSGAIAAVNGDFAAPSGRPIHGFGARGVLVQEPLDDGGSALGLAPGGNARAGRPQVAVSLRPQGQGARAVQHFNRGVPRGHQLAAWTYVSHAVEVVPDNACYALLTRTGRHRVTSGPVQRLLQVAGVRCGGAAPAIPRSGVLVAANRAGRGAAFLRGLDTGQPVLMNQLIGFGGSTAMLGGSEPLVAGTQVLSGYVDRPGFYTQGRHPRTATGVTADGRLLAVVVDGRQPGWSAGMTLRELAALMKRLGAVTAINLDGGGSSTMVLSGLIVNRPSDDAERAVSSSLVMVGPRHLAPVGLARASARPTAALRAAAPASLPGLLAVSNLLGLPGGLAEDWVAAARDPGSVGGLAQSRARSGGVLGGALDLALQLFQAG